MANLIKRVINKVQKEGLQKSSQSAITIFFDYLYDYKYKVDTLSWVEKPDLGEDEFLVNHAVMYQPTRVLALRKMFKILQIADESVFVDMGCGKGRVLLIASEYGFKIVRGIDFSSKLCAIAEENISTYKDRSPTKTQFEVINSDASLYKFKDDEDVFFFFHPFDEVIFKKVLVNIIDSLYRIKRKIKLVYANPINQHLIMDEMNVLKVYNFSLWNIEFSVFEIS